MNTHPDLALQMVTSRRNANAAAHKKREKK